MHPLITQDNFSRERLASQCGGLFGFPRKTGSEEKVKILFGDLCGLSLSKKIPAMAMFYHITHFVLLAIFATCRCFSLYPASRTPRYAHNERRFRLLNILVRSLPTQSRWAKGCP
jgi:hypothetical protein